MEAVGALTLAYISVRLVEMIGQRNIKFNEILISS